MENQQQEDTTIEQGQVTPENDSSSGETTLPSQRQEKHTNLVKILFITFLLIIIIGSAIFIYRPFQQRQASGGSGQPTATTSAVTTPALSPTSTPSPTARPTISAEVSEFYEESPIDTSDNESSLNSVEGSFSSAETVDLDEPQNFDLDL